MRKIWEAIGIVLLVLLMITGAGVLVLKLTGNDDLLDDILDRVMEMCPFLNRHECQCDDGCGCGDEDFYDDEEPQVE